MMEILVIAAFLFGSTAFGQSVTNPAPMIDAPDSKASRGRHLAVDEVIGYETASWIAGKNKDKSAYAGFLADDFTRITEDGLTDKASELHDLDGTDIQKYTLSEMKGAEVTADVVLLTYNFYVKLTTNGHPYEGSFRASSLWAKRGGKWLCVFTQETQYH